MGEGRCGRRGEGEVWCGGDVGTEYSIEETTYQLTAMLFGSKVSTASQNMNCTFW